MQVPWSASNKHSTRLVSLLKSSMPEFVFNMEAHSLDKHWKVEDATKSEEIRNSAMCNFTFILITHLVGYWESPNLMESLPGSSGCFSSGEFPRQQGLVIVCKKMYQSLSTV